MNSAKLTAFQKEAKAVIGNAFGEHDLLIEFHYRGESETYLFGECSHISIWIYEDELELRSRQELLLLERPAFDTLEKMLAYFQERLRTLLTDRDNGTEASTPTR